MEERVITGRVDMLAGLSAEETALFVKCCRVMNVAASERIFAEGDPGDELFIVRSGKVRITKTISQDVVRTLAVIERGGIFGELVIIDAGARSAGAVALEASEVLAMGRDDFQKLVRERSEVGIKFLGRLCAQLAERLRVTNDLLRETIAWGLEVSGAASFSLAQDVNWKATVRVSLLNGRDIVGKLVKVDKGAGGGVELTLKDRAERFHVIPYHAVAEIDAPGEAALQSAEEV